MDSSTIKAMNETIIYVIDLCKIVYDKVPGMSVVGRYVQNSYQNDPFRIVLELFLIIFAIQYLMSKKYKPDSREVVLSEKEVDELIEEWQPESLVPKLSKWEKQDLESVPVIQGPTGTTVTLDDGKVYVNLTYYDFLGLSMKSSIHEAASKALSKYGVGACGPPGFYGTLDAHIDLEKDIARFIGTEDAILYSQAFSTISSVIPAFSKRADTLVVDKGVNFAVQKGVQISRSHIKYFEHNNMKDLERVLKEIDRENSKNRKPLTRKFIVVEGLYQNHGDIVPLPELVELKKKYKYRLIVDESFSLGALGTRGAGVTDHFNVSPKEVDIISGSFANALAGAGGFCAGSTEVVDHQRLSGAAYCFSAALPAVLAIASTEGIGILEKDPSLVKKLRINIHAFRKAFGESNYAELIGDAASPIIHVRLRLRGKETAQEQSVILQKVVDYALKQKFLVSRAKYVFEQEIFPSQPSIRITISAAHYVHDLENAARAIKDGFDLIKGK